MTLSFYNTLTGEKAAFEPLDAKAVGLYVCGPTVYDRPHLGNARSAVVYDVLFRVLRHKFGENCVKYVRNITDVDDKIIARAKERGINIDVLTKEVTQQFSDDMEYLGCLEPNEQPRATEHIGGMVTMIERLIAHGNAYAAPDGHVLFSVMSDPRYGSLSGRKLNELQAGARVAVEGYKQHPGDFVLWKPAAKDDDASAVFDSPWGKGRPGWHIECSVMSTEYLGESFDIHGGGADLKFPHHENEIAQSCCANPGSDFARVWMHNGFLTVNGEKMSKSLGNFSTIDDQRNAGVAGEVVRLAFLTGHYRKPIDWSDKLVADSAIVLRSFMHSIIHGNQEHIIEDSSFSDLSDFGDEKFKEFIDILSEDLNTSSAFAKLHEIKDIIHSKSIEVKDKINCQKSLAKCLSVLGFNLREMLKLDIDSTNKLAKSIDISSKISERKEAKDSKDYAKADAIRKELEAIGILLEDKPGGITEWRKA